MSFGSGLGSLTVSNRDKLGMNAKASETESPPEGGRSPAPNDISEIIISSQTERVTSRGAAIFFAALNSVDTAKRPDQTSA